FVQPIAHRQFSTAPSPCKEAPRLLGIPASQLALCNRLHKVVGNCSGRTGGCKEPFTGSVGRVTLL
ncbi:MAG: hypothetical protein RRB24_12435, partial [Armatimonadota bacterium]|nr:hypothetical protein [Armatimonadota bacterium]